MKLNCIPGILLLVAVAVGCHRQAIEPEPASAKVEGDRLTLPDTNGLAASVSSEPVAPARDAVQHFNGRLAWNDGVTVRVFTPFAGRVSQILVEAGQRVERGAPLALIVSPDFGQAQSDARRAASDFVLADRAAGRLRELFDHGAAAKKDLDAAEADLARARAERDRTLSRIEFYGGSTNGVDQIFPLQSALAGIVVDKNITPGQEVRPDQMLANAPQFVLPLFVVTDPSQMWVELDVAENDARRFKPGQSMIVRSAALPGDSFAGKVELVSESLDPTTHTLRVRGSVDNSAQRLKAEMFVTAELADGELAGLEAPSKAIFLRGDRYFLFLEEQPGSYRRREVRVGDEHGDRIVVLAGLQAGERVVCEGALLLEQMFESASGS